MMKRLNQTGDTIVEVLVALSILSLVLIATYATVNRSTATVRRAQERAEALKVAETQIEQIKAMSVDSDDIFNFNPTPPANGFCTFYDANVLKVLADNDANCKIPNTVGYMISIGRTLTNSTYTFTVKVTWADVKQGTDTLTLNYNLNK